MVQVPNWKYHDRNIQGGVTQSDFTRADRVLVYSAPTPQGNARPEPMKAIGLIQGANISEQKQLQLYYELGSDAPIIIPGMTQGQISFQRVLLNGMNLLNALYHGVDKQDLRRDQILRSIRDIDMPFDLMIAKYPVTMDDRDTRAVETTLFRGCQISNKSESITSGGAVVMENMTVMYQTIPSVNFSNTAS